MVNHTAQFIGVDRFVALLDSTTEYPATIIGDILDYCHLEGFGKIAREFNLPYKTHREFRERYIIEALSKND